MKIGMHHQTKLLTQKHIDQLKIQLPDAVFFPFEHFDELKKSLKKNDKFLNIVIGDKDFLISSELFSFPFAFTDSIKYIIPILKGEEGLIKNLLMKGANGILHREESPECFVQCIKEVIEHGGFVCPKVIVALNSVSNDINNPLSRLSVREKIIMDHILKGKSDKMVADQLRISYHTAKTHRKNIYKKLNINSQGQLFALLT